MILGTVTRILKEDLAKTGSVPEWVDPLVGTLNDFMTKVTQALSQNLAFADNFKGKQYKLELTHGKELSVNPQYRYPILGAIAVDGGGKLISSFGVTSKANKDGSIGVTVNFVGGTSATKATVTFVVLFT